jgi:predicted transcriptional regulator
MMRKMTTGGDLPEAVIEGIKAGLADIEAGRVHSYEYVKAHLEEHIRALAEKKKST